MVKRFNPEAFRDFEGPHDYTGWDATRMKESRFGEWVRLETYKDVTAQLNSQIARLKRQIIKLETQPQKENENE